MPTDTQRGEYSLLEASVPGISATTVGVLLRDPEADQLYVRLRRDWPALLSDEHDVEYFEALEDDLRAKSGEWGADRLLHNLEDSAGNGVLISDRESVLVDRWESALARLYRTYVQPRVLPFRTHLPLYSVQAAAGKFGEHMEAEPEGWIEVRTRHRLSDDMFVAHVTGQSMEPMIPAGALCAFRYGVAGSRTGRHVLVENFGETGENRYTIKRYRRRDDKTVVLEPLNPAYNAWEIDPEDPRIRVIAEFVEVIES